jgi:preprotein translocase subunit SecG
MVFVISLLIVLLVLCAVILTLLVIIQNSKGGGLASNLRGVSNVTNLLGARQSADFAEKGTWLFISVLVVLTFAINIAFSVQRSGGAAGAGEDKLNSILESQRVNKAPTNAPNLNQLPKPAAPPARK